MTTLRLLGSAGQLSQEQQQKKKKCYSFIAAQRPHWDMMLFFSGSFSDQPKSLAHQLRSQDGKGNREYCSIAWARTTQEQTQELVNKYLPSEAFFRPPVYPDFLLVLSGPELEKGKYVTNQQKNGKHRPNFDLVRNLRGLRKRTWAKPGFP